MENSIFCAVVSIKSYPWEFVCLRAYVRYSMSSYSHNLKYKVSFRYLKGLYLVWYDELLFKLKSNNINCHLLKVIERIFVGRITVSCNKWLNLQL